MAGVGGSRGGSPSQPPWPQTAGARTSSASLFFFSRRQEWWRRSPRQSLWHCWPDQRPSCTDPKLGTHEHTLHTSKSVCTPTVRTAIVNYSAKIYSNTHTEHTFLSLISLGMQHAPHNQCTHGCFFREGLSRERLRGGENLKQTPC